MKGLFITGTDTGVGKTYVAVGIAQELVSRGFNVGVMKPAETGCQIRKGQLMPSDALRLMSATGSQDPLSLVNPYRFRNPLAPSVAARLEKKNISDTRLLSAYKTLSQRHEFMIVEGAGGIMVPLSRNYLFLDLAEAFHLPVLIVSRPGLGTINHTLLTIVAMKRRRIKIAGVVVNYAEKWKQGLAERTSAAVIEALSGVRVLGTVGNKDRNFRDIVDKL